MQERLRMVAIGNEEGIVVVGGSKDGLEIYA